MLTIGASEPGPCGVRDYARSLATGREVWLDVPPHRGWRQGWYADRALLRAARAAASRGDAAVFHWSPFTHGAHGVPMLAAFVPLALRRKGVRTATVLHELAYPWGRRGVRGAVWAVAQRVVLAPVVAGSDLLLVTTDERAEWLRRRYRRDAVVRPVWETVPVAADVTGEGSGLGTLSWSHDVVRRDLALEAARGGTLQLLGGPGPDSPSAEAWRADARRYGVTLDFSGVLDPAALSERIAALGVYLHLDSSGPTPRRTSLANALAHGRPVLAVDGPQTWRTLGDAVVLAAPDAYARAARELLADPGRRREVGARGRAFFEREMDRAATVRLLEERLAP